MVSLLSVGTDEDPGLAAGSYGLSRTQVLDRILRLNASATADFLDEFSDESLAEYLDHLALTCRPRSERTRWVRRGNAPAISWREPRE